MRNLKRALSLALACVMLLGMMATGAGAAGSTISSFPDADKIVNVEAAEVTTGLKIFEGYNEDGTFRPETEVTRAQMAVIICKIINGSDVEPSNFTGVSSFTDVPAWAEGYVNYCASMGIIVGVGEGKFNPNDTVTTVQAATMLLKALGYFTEEDQLAADWKTVVTGRATSLKLYGDLTLGVDEGLTRDNVAELVFNTLFAQRVAYDDNRHLYVKNTNRDVVVTNGTNDPLNTFAMNTFDMWYIDGLVTANSYTQESLSETVNNGNRTEVQFYDKQDYGYMGGANVSHYPFEYETDLEMIGHAARVYYSMDRNAPVVYAIADRATKTAIITYNSNTTTLSNAANEAGFRRNTILNLGESNWKVNYDWDRTVGVLAGTGSAVDLDGSESVDPNKTLVVISNSSDFAVDCVIVLDQYLDTVRRVVTPTGGETEYDLTTIDGDDMNILHGDAAEGDYVIVTDIGKRGDVLNFTKAETVSANITRITGVSDGNGTVKSIVADGTTYYGSPVYDHMVRYSELADTTDFEDIATVGESTLILDEQGLCIGLGEPEGTPSYAYAAQFGVRHITSGLNTKEMLTVQLFFADGTSGAYVVSDTASTSSRINTFASYKYRSGDEDLMNEGTDSIYTPVDNYDSTFDARGLTGLSGLLDSANKTGLGVYRVSVRSDDTVVLTALHHDGAVDKADRAQLAKARLVPGHSTLVVTEDNAALTAAGDQMRQNGNVTYQGTDNPAAGGTALYMNNRTVFFYVDGGVDRNGKYDSDTLTVGARVGVANAIKLTHGTEGDAAPDDTFEQVFVKTADNRHTVPAMLIHGIEVDANNNIYFYNEGHYKIDVENAASRADGKITLTYELYTLDGEAYEATYDNNGRGFESASAAREEADSVPTGFYTVGRTKLEEVTTVNALKNSRQYVVDAELEYSEYTNNLYVKSEVVGGIFTSDTKIVDLSGSGLDTVSNIIRALDRGATIKIAYAYRTGSTDSYVIKAVFITDYAPSEGNSNVANPGLYVSYNGTSVYLYNPINATTGIRSNATAVAAAVKAELEGHGITVTNVFVSGDNWQMTLNGGGYSNATIAADTAGNAVASWVGLANYANIVVPVSYVTAPGLGSQYLPLASRVNLTARDSERVYRTVNNDSVTKALATVTPAGGSSCYYAVATADLHNHITLTVETPDNVIDIDSQVATAAMKVNGESTEIPASQVSTTIEVEITLSAPGRALSAGTFDAEKYYWIQINDTFYGPVTGISGNKATFTVTVPADALSKGELVLNGVFESSTSGVESAATVEGGTLTDALAEAGVTAEEIEDATATSDPVVSQPGVVTVSVSGTGDAGSYTTDYETLDEAGREYTITVTDASYASGDTYAVTVEGGTGVDNGDGTMTVTYTTPGEIPEEGLILNIGVVKTAAGVESGAALAAIWKNPDADDKGGEIYIAQYEDPDESKPGDEDLIAIIQSDLETAVKITKVGSKIYAISTEDESKTWEITCEQVFKIYLDSTDNQLGFAGGDFKVVENAAIKADSFFLTSMGVGKSGDGAGTVTASGAATVAEGKITYTTVPAADTTYYTGYKVASADAGLTVKYQLPGQSGSSWATMDSSSLSSTGDIFPAGTKVEIDVGSPSSNYLSAVNKAGTEDEEVIVGPANEDSTAKVATKNIEEMASPVALTKVEQVKVKIGSTYEEYHTSTELASLSIMGDYSGARYVQVEADKAEVLGTNDDDVTKGTALGGGVMTSFDLSGLTATSKGDIVLVEAVEINIIANSLTSLKYTCPEGTGLSDQTAMGTIGANTKLYIPKGSTIDVEWADVSDGGNGDGEIIGVKVGDSGDAAAPATGESTPGAYNGGTNSVNAKLKGYVIPASAEAITLSLIEAPATE